MTAPQAMPYPPDAPGALTLLRKAEKLGWEASLSTRCSPDEGCSTVARASRGDVRLVAVWYFTSGKWHAHRGYKWTIPGPPFPLGVKAVSLALEVSERPVRIMS